MGRDGQTNARIIPSHLAKSYLLSGLP